MNFLQILVVLPQIVSLRPSGVIEFKSSVWFPYSISNRYLIQLKISLIDFERKLVLGISLCQIIITRHQKYDVIKF